MELTASNQLRLSARSSTLVDAGIARQHCPPDLPVRGGQLAREHRHALTGPRRAQIGVPSNAGAHRTTTYQSDVATRNGTSVRSEGLAVSRTASRDQQ
jgi:hypothetical protein